NDFSSAFDRIVEQNSRYYALGYYPPTHAADGTFHAIEVRVKRPGMKVTARRGYVSESATPPRAQSAQPGDILDTPLQQTGLSFSVHAAPFRQAGDGASVALSIEIDGGQLTFAPAANGFASDKVELSFYAADEHGVRGAGTRQAIDLNLKPDT